MKRVIPIVVAVAVLGMPATARGQGVSGGARFGVNFADLSFDTTETPNSKFLPGLVAGIFIAVPAGAAVAFQPEVLFSMQGTQFSEQGQTAKVKIDYVQIPLLGRFRVTRGSPVAILAGPTLGFRTRARFEVPGAPEEFGDDFEDEVERMDIGIVAGLTADVGRLVLDGRYTWGLRNIARDESGRDSAKNRVLSFSAGVRF